MDKWYHWASCVFITVLVGCGVLAAFLIAANVAQNLPAANNITQTQ